MNLYEKYILDKLFNNKHLQNSSLKQVFKSGQCTDYLTNKILI